VTSVDGVLNNVTVTVKGTTNSTQTNASGEYSITAASNDVLVFSSVGFNAQEITINGQSAIDVKMSSSSQMMTDVVVVGYGTKRSMTGKAQIRYNAYVGFDNIAHWLDPLSPEAYVQKYADYKAQVPTAPQTVLPNNYEIANYNAGKTVDWLNEATQQGIIQDH